MRDIVERLSSTGISTPEASLLEDAAAEIVRLREVILALNDAVSGVEWEVAGGEDAMGAWDRAWRRAFLVECEVRPSASSNFHAAFHREALGRALRG